MKHRIFLLTAMIALLILSATSCEDPEPFVEFKTIETEIYNALRAHRENSGISGAFVHQYVIGKEAQLYSATMASGSQDVTTSGLESHWIIIHSKIGGINDLSLVQKTSSTSTAAEIVKVWTDDTDINSDLLLEYTQCGVGVEYDDNDMAYVTLMLMLVQ